MQPRSVIISVVNNKGGVGKTTTTCNLADALARKGKSVLVLDMDSQCNATSMILSGERPNANTLFELLGIIAYWDEKFHRISSNFRYHNSYKKFFTSHFKKPVVPIIREA